MDLQKGDKVWFEEEKQGYTIRDANDRYLVCTKPFNPKHTVIYSIVDQWKNIRGTDNIIGCAGYETDDECKDALKMLVTGELEISRRNTIPLRIRQTRRITKTPSI